MGYPNKKYTMNEIEAFEEAFAQVLEKRIFPVVPGYPYVILDDNYKDVFGYFKDIDKAREKAKEIAKKLEVDMVVSTIHHLEKDERASDPDNENRAKGAFIIVDMQGNYIGQALNEFLAFKAIDGMYQLDKKSKHAILVDFRGFDMLGASIKVTKSGTEDTYNFYDFSRLLTLLTKEEQAHAT